MSEALIEALPEGGNERMNEVCPGPWPAARRRTEDGLLSLGGRESDHVYRLPAQVVVFRGGVFGARAGGGVTLEGAVGGEGGGYLGGRGGRGAHRGLVVEVGGGGGGRGKMWVVVRATLL